LNWQCIVEKERPVGSGNEAMSVGHASGIDEREPDWH